MADAAVAVALDVDAVAFDLDGTLLDTIDDLAAALNRLLAERGLPALPKATIRDFVGKGMANLLTRALAMAGAPVGGAEELAPVLARYQEIYGGLLGDETRVFPDVEESLARMRAAGVGLAVVTNKASRFVRPHLACAGIEAYFDVVIGGEDAPAKKPDPAPLLLAAERLGVRPARLLMVGDSGNDVEAARAAGCPVLVVPYGYSEGVPVQALRGDGIVPTLAAVADRVAARANDTAR